MTDTATANPPASAVVSQLPAGTLAVSFNKAAEPFLHATLTRETAEAVEQLHQHFSQRIQATVDAALPGSTDEDLKKACAAYCLALSRTRKECSARQVAEKAAKGIEAVQAETKILLTDLAELEATL